MVLTNELPELEDTSGALANRFLILELAESFIGREDTDLTDRLITELPGILMWAIEGLVRLRSRGKFQPPESSAELVREMEALASPVGAFVSECCRIAVGAEVVCDDLYVAWTIWAKAQGRKHPGTVQVFGRNLRTVVQKIRTIQPREDGKKGPRTYSGIRLTEEAIATLAVERANMPDKKYGAGRG